MPRERKKGRRRRSDVVVSIIQLRLSKWEKNREREKSERKRESDGKYKNAKWAGAESRG